MVLRPKNGLEITHFEFVFGHRLPVGSQFSEEDQRPVPLSRLNDPEPNTAVYQSFTTSETPQAQKDVQVSTYILSLLLGSLFPKSVDHDRFLLLSGG